MYIGKAEIRLLLHCANPEILCVRLLVTVSFLSHPFAQIIYS